MNYLAHAYLSFNKKDILAGNMISDFVKGKSKFNYSEGIQKGMHLHRLIDAFTDAHPATANAKKFFRSTYRLYSGAFVDIVYDHFLALDTKQFDEYNGLKKFSKQVYHLLENNFTVLPVPFQNLFFYMKHQDWLYNYQFKEGIKKSFQGLARRAAYLQESDIAFIIFNKNYFELKNCYDEFFPQVKQFTFQNLNNMRAD